MWSAEGGQGRADEGLGGHQEEAGGPHPVLQQEGGGTAETARTTECQVKKNVLCKVWCQVKKNVLCKVWCHFLW